MQDPVWAMKPILYDMGLLTLVRWLLQRDFKGIVSPVHVLTYMM